MNINRLIALDCQITFLEKLLDNFTVGNRGKDCKNCGFQLCNRHLLISKRINKELEILNSKIEKEISK